MHASFLRYRDYRWLKVGGLLCAVATLVYALHEPLGRPSGGTWLGYGLGTLGAVLILWLMAFGLRKRSYQMTGPPLVGWLSAHVWLGLSLVVVATLHTGFQLGWNVHSLAYVLMLLVIASGVWGMVLYRRLPTALSANRQELTLPEMLQVVAGLDREARTAAATLDERINAAVLAAARDTRIGGTVWQQLRGHDPRCATTLALAEVRAAAATVPVEQSAAAQEVITVLARKKAALERVRRDVRLRAVLQSWLLLHVPLSFMLVAALLAHVVAVLLLR